MLLNTTLLNASIKKTTNAKMPAVANTTSVLSCNWAIVGHDTFFTNS